MPPHPITICEIYRFEKFKKTKQTTISPSPVIVKISSNVKCVLSFYSTARAKTRLLALKHYNMLFAHQVTIRVG